MLYGFSAFCQSGQLYQAAFNGESYEYGFTSIPVIDIVNAPEDTDWERWSLLFDGDTYRLYFMPIGRSDKLYQFGFNPATSAYEYGHRSTPVIPIIGLPDDANVTGFSMLHDGIDYRLYFMTSDKSKVYQCAYNSNAEGGAAYEFGYRSAPEISIIDAPYDTDWRSWSMLHDGNVYRLYLKSTADGNALYQFGFDGSAYTYGYRSTPIIRIKGMPRQKYVRKFNLTHDGQDYRYYNLKKPD